MDSLIQLAKQLYWNVLILPGGFLEPGFRLFWLWCLPFLALVCWRARRTEAWRARPRGGGGWLARAFPADIWLHPSSRMDLLIIVINTALRPVTWVSGVFSAALIGSWLSTQLAPFWPDDWRLSWSSGSMLLFTLISVLVLDFKTYVVHRAFHEVSWLWPFHALHHSAEVLTPLTAYRTHPVYLIVSASMKAVFSGVTLGLVHTLMLGEASLWTLLGVNAFYLLLFFPLGNFRHSQVWLEYPDWLGRWLSSPVMHQIHHSSRPEHHDKNYGELFSIWDRWFGTWVKAERHVPLELGIYGLAQQPHRTLLRAYLLPFQQSWQALRKSLFRNSAAPMLTKSVALPEQGER